MTHAHTLPKTDKEADERLIEVVCSYVGEREMPFKVAYQVLLDNLRDKSMLGKGLLKLAKI
jgi:hypothetical protein